MRNVFKQFGLSLVTLPVMATVFAAVIIVGTPATAAAAPAQITRITHHTAPQIRLSQHGRNSTSSNWSGYATTGTTYTDVQASWTQPTGNCSDGQTAYSSFWIGLDGDGTNSVEQTGSEVDCSGGSPIYYAWYEMYPAYPVNYANTVRPGDSFSAEVKYIGSNKFQLSITDHTQNWSHSVTKALRRAGRGSAEWIAEAPSSGSGVLPLANFGTVNFSNCTANSKSISSNPNPDAITMASGSTTKAVPSGLGSGGESFSVTWKHH